MRFAWRKGFRATHVDPDEVGARLEALRKKLGRALTAEDVVEDAKVKSAPHHDAFEWDDGKAAAEHRKEQARSLLRSLLVVQKGTTTEARVLDPKTEIRIVRQYEHSPEKGGYFPTKLLLKKQSTREALLEQAWSDLQSWKRRYESLIEFAEVLGVIDEGYAKFLEDQDAA